MSGSRLRFPFTLDRCQQASFATGCTVILYLLGHALVVPLTTGNWDMAGQSQKWPNSVSVTALKFNQEPKVVFQHQNVWYVTPNPANDKWGAALLMKGQDYHKWIIDAIHAEVKQDDHILDIGSNLGYISLPLKRRFPGLRITMIDGSDTYMQYLHTALALNGFHSGIRTILTGLSSEPSVKKLCVADPENIGHTKVVELTELPKAACKTIRIRTLDSLNIECASVVKMDIEGYETSVVRGGLSWFRRCQPRMVIAEYHMSDGKPLILLLQGLGYTRVMDMAVSKTMPIITTDDVDMFMLYLKRYEHDSDHTDLLFRR